MAAAARGEGMSHMNKPLATEFAASSRYDPVARILHWLMALALLIMLLLGGGWIAHGSGLMSTIHVSVGFTLLALGVLRLGWRLYHHPPALPSSISRTYRRLATGLQAIMYLVMIAIPVIGWFAFTEHVHRHLGVRMASFFGVAKIPLLPDFRLDFHFAHRWLGRALLAIIALHVLAALKHQFIDKNSLLQRML